MTLATFQAAALLAFIVSVAAMIFQADRPEGE